MTEFQGTGLRSVNNLQTDPSNNPDRIGAVCGSDSHRAFLKNGYSEDYILEKIAERETNAIDPIFATWDMRRGQQLEPLAKECAEGHYNRKIIDLPFRLHPTIRFYGASPDGIWADDPSTLIEIKCKKKKNHLKFILNSDFTEHKQQMLNQICCHYDKGVRSVDIMYFHPDFEEEGMRLRVINFKPTEQEIKEHEQKIADLIWEIQQTQEKIKGLI